MTVMMTMGDHKRTHKPATKQKKCPACFLLVCLAQLSMLLPVFYD